MTIRIPRTLIYLAGFTLTAAVLPGRPVRAFEFWTLVSLHPQWARQSSAYAITDGAQGGMIDTGDYSWGYHAAAWRGSAASAKLLDSSPYYSYVNAMDGVSWVGNRGVNPVRAQLWTDGQAGAVDLTPAGSSYSQGLAVHGSTQGGGAEVGNHSHAALWNGTAGSFVDLNPSGALSSSIRAMDTSGQAGDLSLVQGIPRAALWHGTADSVVDLHPADAYASSAQAISNGRQGGYVQFVRDGPRHAALWSGTADSFLDLTPAGGPTIAGAIAGIDGNIQVGNAGFVDGSGGATVWFGTPESAFYLGSLLSSDYTETWAYAVDIDEFGTIRVVGSAYNNNYYLPDGTYFPRNEAMMWVLVPEPSSLAALVAGLAGLAGVRPRRRR